MARINLLPWRAERRKQRQREFGIMLGMAALGGLLLSLLIWFYYDMQVSGQNDRNAYLQTEIDKVKEQNKEIDRLDEQKNRLLARKAVPGADKRVARDHPAEPEPTAESR